MSEQRKWRVAEILAVALMALGAAVMVASLVLGWRASAPDPEPQPIRHDYPVGASTLPEKEQQ